MEAAQRNESIPVLDVSISELVANPIFYNNVVVRVHGAAVSRFEANVICESVDDIKSPNGRCLWLEPVAKDGLLGPIDSVLYHNKIVILIGVFDKDYRGRGRYSGAIAPISVVAKGRHAKGDIPPPPPEP